MKKDKKIGGHFFYDINKFFLIWIVLLFFRPKYFYASKTAKEKLRKYKIRNSFICSCNHNSLNEPAYLQAAFPLRRIYVLAAHDIVDGLKSEWMLKKLLAVPIHRNEEMFSIEDYKKIVFLLKDGQAINIFSEGKLNENIGTLLPFKKGTALFSIRTNTPVIPIYLKTRKNKFERLKIGFGEPINFAELGFGKNDIDKATEYLYKKNLEIMNLVLEKTK